MGQAVWADLRGPSLSPGLLPVCRQRVESVRGQAAWREAQCSQRGTSVPGPLAVWAGLPAQQLCTCGPACPQGPSEKAGTLCLLVVAAVFQRRHPHQATVVGAGFPPCDVGTWESTLP